MPRAHSILVLALAGYAAVAACDDPPDAARNQDPAMGGTASRGRMACGDCVIDSDETCDDCNTVDGDGCSATCTVEGTCDDLRACCFNVICPRVGCNTVPANVCDDGTLYAIAMNGDSACARTLAQLDAPACRAQEPTSGGAGAIGVGGEPAGGPVAGGNGGATNASAGSPSSGESGEPGSDADTCPRGTTECGGHCVYLKRDHDNCGSCGRTCGKNQVCEAGECTCGPGWQTACGSACFDLNWNNANCGACGVECPDGTWCSNGSCTCIGSTVPGGESGGGGIGGGGGGVGGGITDCTPATRENCPILVHDAMTVESCASSQICSVTFEDTTPSGTCQAFCDQTLCPGGACVPIATDPSNCGKCGRVCAAGEECDGGVCTSLLTECDGKLTDTGSDWHNCGDCGNECPNPGCWVGMCVCRDICDDGCTDSRFDVENCGECGHACADTDFCDEGACRRKPIPSAGGSCSSQHNTAVCSPDFTSYGYQYLCEAGESPPSGVACDYVGAEAAVTVWCCNH